MIKINFFLLIFVMSLISTSGQAQWNFWHSLSRGCSDVEHKENGGCQLNSQTCSLNNATSCSKTWQPATLNYKYVVTGTYEGGSYYIDSYKTFFPIAAGQSVRVGYIGSIQLGASGGYSASYNSANDTYSYSSNYGTSYSYTSACLTGTLLYRFGTSGGWTCAVPGSTITNNTGSSNPLTFTINDGDNNRNNSGTYTITFTFVGK